MTSPTRSSLNTSQPTSRSATSPRAIARTIERHRLAADVAAGADQERDEEAQRHDRGQLALEVRAAPCRCSASAMNSSSSQPTRLRTSSGDARQAVRDVQRLRAAEALDVLGGLGLRTSATSSSVMIPIRRSSSSTTGMASRLRSVRSRAAVSWSAEARTRTVVGRHQLDHRRVGRGSAAGGTATARRAGAARRRRRRRS